MGFTPQVFWKAAKERNIKGEDIALTKDMLANAFLDNYDVAVIFTSDADFVPVISEVTRLGKSVCVLAFELSGAAIGDDLRLSADFFCAFDDEFAAIWRAAIRDTI